MAQVTVMVNQRAYQVACEDGQEQQIKLLADYVDRHVQDMVGAVGQVGEGRLLVMSALMVADELSSVLSELDSVKAKLKDLEDSRDASTPVVDPLVDRIEAMVKKLENA